MADENVEQNEDTQDEAVQPTAAAADAEAAEEEDHRTLVLAVDAQRRRRDAFRLLVDRRVDRASHSRIAHGEHVRPASLIDLQQNERSLGGPTVRLEIEFVDRH